MKKTLLTITLAIASLVVVAQDNAVKFHIGSLAMKTIYFSYERALSESKSVTIGLHRTSMSGGAFAEAFEDDGQGEGTVNLEIPTLKGWGITAEYRMYTSKSKEGLSGFYFAPFLRHSQYTIATEGVYEQDNGDEFIGKQSLTLKNNLGLGFIIGTHFNVSEKFSIDVTWIGFGVSASKIQGEITAEDPTIDFRDSENDLKQEVADDKYLDSYTIEKNKATVTSIGFKLPIIRGNLALVYKF